MSTARANKGGARKTVYNDVVYDSKLEADYAKLLQLFLFAGSIRSWTYHPCRLPLVINGTKVGTYAPDFEVNSIEGDYFVETKGWIPREWPFRLKVIRACYPDLDLRIVRREDF